MSELQKAESIEPPKPEYPFLKNLFAYHPELLEIAFAQDAELKRKLIKDKRIYNLLNAIILQLTDKARINGMSLEDLIRTMKEDLQYNRNEAYNQKFTALKKFLEASTEIKTFVEFISAFAGQDKLPALAEFVTSFSEQDKLPLLVNFIIKADFSYLQTETYKKVYCTANNDDVFVADINLDPTIKTILKMFGYIFEYGGKQYIKKALYQYVTEIIKARNENNLEKLLLFLYESDTSLHNICVKQDQPNTLMSVETAITQYKKELKVENQHALENLVSALTQIPGLTETSLEEYLSMRRFPHLQKIALLSAYKKAKEEINSLPA